MKFVMLVDCKYSSLLFLTRMPSVQSYLCILVISAWNKSQQKKDGEKNSKHFILCRIEKRHRDSVCCVQKKFM